MKPVGIIGTGRFLPEKILTNFDLEKMVDTTDEWIKTRTGIENRRILQDGVGTSFMASKAGEKALEAAGMTAEEIDMIVVATVTADMSFPSTACRVQEQIGAKNAFAFDVNAACTGFIYAISVANSMIQNGTAKNALVIGADALSKITDYTDRSTAVLFADGAGAVVLSEVEEGTGVLSTALGSDGTGGKFLYLPGGGSLNPASEETVEKGMHYIHMDGSEVFKFAARKMAEVSLEALENANLNLEDIDYLVPHQANTRIINNAAKRLKISQDKIYINIHDYGNMSSASIPVALDEALEKKLIKKDDVVLLVGFGAGLTWGASLIKWSI